MNYGQLVTKLRSIIIRKDVTDTALKGWIQQAMEGLQREVLPGFLEKLAVYTAEDEALSEIFVPTDYLTVRSLFTDSSELARVDVPTYLRAAHDRGAPRMFVQQRGKLLMRPALPQGQSLTLHYYGEDDQLVDPADVNGWSATAANALLYGAARHFAIEYEDERGPTFDAAYQAEVQALRDQDTVDRWSAPLSISPGFSI